MSTWSFDRADVVRVIDADNLELDVVQDCGFNDTLTRRRSFRLFGVNARELDDPGGLAAYEHLRALLPAGTSVRLGSVKNDKFGGRFDAVVTLPDGRDLAMLLVGQQWASPWNGRGPKPVPPWPRTVQ